MLTVNIYEPAERSERLTAELLKVWEDSVRATHLFLSEAEIAQIKTYVPQALDGVERLTVAEDGQGRAISFMGTEGARLEMLFIAPQYRGMGIGSRLLRRAVSVYGVNELTVNEQNPQAAGFYEHMGFAICKRTDCDEQGAPYPLLYMKLSEDWEDENA